MKIALIGAGNMGEAILSGLHKKYTCVICEARAERCVYLKKKYRCSFVDSPVFALTGADVVLLAVKPQDMAVVLSSMKPALGRQLFISIAAGITASFIEKALGGNVRVVRSMPNLPALIAQGVTAVSGGKYATSGDLKKAQDILMSVGPVMVVPEKMMNAVTAVSGSGPAYVFLLAESMMKAARKFGFSESEAELLVVQTLRGSAEMLTQSQDTAEGLRQKVTSKGGTTQAATDMLMAKDMPGVLLAAMSAAKDRAKELAM